MKKGTIPIGSMGLVYLPTFAIQINHKCRYICQSHGSYRNSPSGRPLTWILVAWGLEICVGCDHLCWISRCWFLYIQTLKIGEDETILTHIFSDGLVQPPTTGRFEWWLIWACVFVRDIFLAMDIRRFHFQLQLHMSFLVMFSCNIQSYVNI